MTLYSKHIVYDFAIPLSIDIENPFSTENHSMFRIILVEAGTGILKINNQSFVFMSPALFCLNERDTIVLVKACDVKAQVIYFDPTIINSYFTLDKVYNIDNFDKNTSIQDYFYLDPFLNRSKKTSPYFELGLMMFKRLTQLSKMLYEETHPCQNEYWICRSRSFFLEILFIVQNIYMDYKEADIIQTSDTDKDLQNIILYLHTNYQNSITIEELTKTFHINRTTLAQRFRAATGMSIKDYLIKLRIKLSAVMLRDTLLPISEIMYRVGFNEANHFSRTFKNIMNCSPSDYRKEYYP